MQKKISIIILLALSVIGAWFFGRMLTSTSQIAQPTPSATSDQLQIYTSFYPLYFFTTEIVGDKAQVHNLTQAGVEPHDFEPGTQDLRQLSQADLVIGNGLGFEPWLEKFAENIPQEKLILASDEITDTLITSADLEGEHKIDEDHAKVGTDPHVWLDPTLASKQVALISTKLQTLDPKNASLYQENTMVLQQKLQTLDQQFQQGLASCQLDHIITAHQAFAYLAARYGFKQLSILGLNPEEEPSPKALAELTQLAKDYAITHVFFETALSSRLAETLAQEVGAKTLVFNPLENLSMEELQTGTNYFSVQEKNLAHLRQALNCQ